MLVTFKRDCLACGSEVTSRGHDGATAWPVGLKAGPRPPCPDCLAALAWIGLGFNVDTAGLAVPTQRELRLRWLQELEEGLGEAGGLSGDDGLLLIRECRRLDAALAATAVQLKQLSDMVSGPPRPDARAALRLRFADDMA